MLSVFWMVFLRKQNKYKVVDISWREVTGKNATSPPPHTHMHAYMHTHTTFTHTHTHTHTQKH